MPEPGLALWAFIMASAGIAALFGAYPLALRLLATLRPRLHAVDDALRPRLCVITAVHNGASLIGEKIADTLAQDYPSDRLNVVVFSDGSDDETLSVAREAAHAHGEHQDQVLVIGSESFDGKAQALNQAVLACQGEVLVFSDADARLTPGTLNALVRHFADPAVGGVCGLRVPRQEGTALDAGQSTYVAADSTVKRLESLVGSITSNDGKLYAMRRELFEPIAPDVTDDLFCCLTVVRRGSRFVFEPLAKAAVPTPSRSARHELDRRRRIVCRSLTGILRQRTVLNPLHHGAFALGLLLNKVLRRLLPLLLLAALVSAWALARHGTLGWLLLLPQLAFYALATSAALPLPEGRTARTAATAAYFCVGNLGMLLGLYDFLRGRRVVRWTPRKTG